MGGFITALGAFLIFALTMGLLIFLMAFLGASSGPALAVPLRVFGRRVQKFAGLVIVLVGVALVYSGAVGGGLDQLVLPS